MILLGLRVHVRPAGEAVDFRATVPVKPPIGATVIVELAEAPARDATLAGLALTLKSTVTTLKVTVAE